MRRHISGRAVRRYASEWQCIQRSFLPVPNHVPWRARAESAERRRRRRCPCGRQEARVREVAARMRVFFFCHFSCRRVMACIYICMHAHVSIFPPCLIEHATGSRPPGDNRMAQVSPPPAMVRHSLLPVSRMRMVQQLRGTYHTPPPFSELASSIPKSLPSSTSPAVAIHGAN